MESKTYLLTLSIFFTLISCNNNAITEPTQTPSTLLFSSGFEEDVYIDSTIYVDSEDYRFIRGKDQITGYSWPISINGAQNSAIHYIADDNHQAVNAQLQTVIGHNGDSTKALYQVEHYAFKGYTQCPYEVLDITEGTKDVYVKYWIKLDSASLHQKDKWRTFFEYKTKEYSEGNGFRLISFIYTDKQGNPFWHFQGDKNSTTPIWEIDNTTVAVPINKWFLTEFYWHWSEGEDGRALWKVNGEVVGEHFGPTTRNSKPIDFILLAQIYGDANPKHQWIDDIEIWDGLPE